MVGKHERMLVVCVHTYAYKHTYTHTSTHVTHDGGHIRWIVGCVEITLHVGAIVLNLGIMNQNSDSETNRISVHSLRHHENHIWHKGYDRSEARSSKELGWVFQVSV